MKRRILSAGLLLSVIFYSLESAAAAEILLTPQETMLIGEMVFANECALKEECLLHWNEGEDFLSLGIGHFIWYPKGKRGLFKESFPGLIEHLKSCGIEIPAWLNRPRRLYCPWGSRKEFLESRDDPRMLDLRRLLAGTKPQQAAFMLKRLQGALALMLKRTPRRSRKNLSRQFQRMAESFYGVYALVDYANFKGLGIKRSERYAREGWGLLQVLLEMRDEKDAPDAAKEFALAADKVLSRRVANSPLGGNEAKWLAGWRKRINTYYREQ